MACFGSTTWAHSICSHQHFEQVILHAASFVDSGEAGVTVRILAVYALLGCSLELAVAADGKLVHAMLFPALLRVEPEAQAAV